jgi:hypothetical protein
MDPIVGPALFELFDGHVRTLMLSHNVDLKLLSGCGTTQTRMLFQARWRLWLERRRRWAAVW